jgi:hypothetical protein
MHHVVLFDKLATERRRHAETLNHPDFAGIRRMVTHRHQNDTHFLYELLQNANDAQALEACFALYPDGLAFYHDAIRHNGAPFTITDPDLTTAGCATARPGHVNAITSIGHGSKSTNPDEQPQQGNTIGKFGTGFKSVFVFTKTPHIYDQDFAFRIEDLIVPNLLRNDESKPHFPWDATQHPTLFWFPFNAGDEQWREKAYHDIAKALTELRLPLLFLPSLRGIAWQVYEQNSRIPDQKPCARGSYLREDAPVTAAPLPLSQVTLQLTTLHHKNTAADHSASHVANHRFLTFSQPAPGRPDLSTVLAFALRPNGTLDTEQLFEVFCYFSTKEAHDLRFIIQAPWSLGDSRELLRGGDPWNGELITQAAGLLASSLATFRDLVAFPQVGPPAPDAPARPTSLLTDDLLRLLPLDRAPLDAGAKRSGVSFVPLHEAVTAALKAQRILPTSSGTHVTAANAYLSESEELLLTFAEPQLRQLVNNPSAAWIFPSLNKSRPELVDYILTLLPGGRRDQQLTAPKVANRFTAAFAAQQTTAWFATLYRFLDTGPGRSLLITGERPLRDKPFLRLEPVSSDATPAQMSAWHSDGTPQVFLPTTNPTPGIATLHNDLASDPTLVGFRQLIGIGTPDLLAIIENQILPRYAPTPGITVTDAEHLDHYRTLLQCWTANTNDLTRRYRLASLLTEQSIVRRAGKIGALGWMRPSKAYLPSPELKTYFHATPSVALVDIEFYTPLADEYDLTELNQLWLSAKVAACPRIISLKDDPTSDDRASKASGHGGYDMDVTNYNLDLLFDNLLTPTLEWSIILYNYLLHYLELQSPLLQRTYRYSYYRVYEINTPSSLTKMLLSHNWLYDANGVCQPTSYFQRNPVELAPEYDQSSATARQLLRALSIHDERDALLSEHLSPTELEALRLLTQQLNSGLSASDILAALRSASASIGTSPQPSKLGDQPTSGGANPSPTPTPVGPTSEAVLSIRRQAVEAARCARETQEQERIEALRRGQQPSSDDGDDRDQPDTDPATAAADRTAKARERQQQHAEEQAEDLLRRAELDIDLETLPRYSYAWCQKALELESLLSAQQYESTTEVRITFASATLDPLDRQQRTLILRDPARYIPRNLEDRPNLELELGLADGTTKSVLIDIASVKDFTLRVRLPKPLTEASIDLDQVRRFAVRVASPAFLAETLRTHFNQLSFAPAKDLRASLPPAPRIRFIFGPPGTGKTQHLADNEIRRLMQTPNSEARILVLTPTNKAADVLTKRLLDTDHHNSQSKVAPSWLIRYGTAADPELPNVPGLVCGPQDTDLDAMRCCTVITTIARFPYATYNSGFVPQPLAKYPWDYIILDEASMIPLVAALNVIYHSPNCREFVIGGDPKQIPPVVLAPPLAEENLYTLVQLNDFETTRTELHHYQVVPLTKQYRATPPLGELFSQYAYRGKLTHARPLAGTLPNPRGGSFTGRRNYTFGKLTLPDLTIIRFPVQHSQSIIQARRLQQGSQYHPYSALLTAEIVRYVAQHIAPRPSSAQPFRIGVISPYTAQAALAREVLKQMDLPADVIDPSEHVGTIHGFQGDECDLIFALISPPEYIAEKPRFKPMLEREYILNVAISRAKDRLILLVPDENTRNYASLKELNFLLDLARTHIQAHGGTLAEYHADDIERSLFGRADYLTDNSFSSGHQTVNVFGPTERRYEVRLSDTAIDVQFNLSVSG